MSLDCSRFSFHPWKDFFGVVMQQGRVQLDSDWNEWVAEIARRLQAGTLDTLGRAVVPRVTPDGFRIEVAAGEVTIGRGRMYVDGLLAENHGDAPLQWDAALAESTGSTAVSFLAQPYLPFNAAPQPAPADVFDPPALTGGPHLMYVDVWQRDLTYLQDPDLVEKAVGVDTTARVQTVWQVRLLPDVGNITCATPDDEVPGWTAATQPSGARLTTSTGDVPGDVSPCTIPPAAGYKGLENQLYRVEVHRGGSLATATFKWSRDNATVASRVTEIQGLDHLIVDSLGRDEVLAFHAGEWVEVTDDWHELHGVPGRLRRIRPADGVDPATRSIFLTDALPADLFPVDAQGRTDPARHTRVRRWDQAGVVRRADGTAFHDLGTSASSDGIPLPPAATVLTLEHGILVEFSQAAPGEFRTGDHWVFAARAADASIELLQQAPPRGIHHHYARLALVTFPDSETDCRTLWPPEVTGESCDCTVCVHAEAHNAGTATIQQAIDAVRTRGGTVCLDAGTYVLAAPLDLEGARSVRLRGQGWRTLLQAPAGGIAIEIQQGIGIAIENLAVLGAPRDQRAGALIAATNCVDLVLSHLAVVALGNRDIAATAVGLAGVLLGASIRDCTLVADHGVAGLPAKREYLLTANLQLCDSVLFCSRRGVHLAGTSMHYGQFRVARNLVLACAEAGLEATGGALPNATVTIEDNVLHVPGSGVVAGTDNLRIADNEIVGGAGRTAATGIVLAPGLDKGALDRAQVTGNRLRGINGHGLALRTELGQAMIKGNAIESVTGAALAMEEGAQATYLCIENNQFTDLGLGFNDEGRPYIGLLLTGVKRSDVVGNLFARVARQAIQSQRRTAIMAIGSGEIRIAGNRLFGIGPASSFRQQAIGIAVEASAQQIAIADNDVARVDSGADVTELAEWQAIVIAGGPRRAVTGAPLPGLSVPGIVLLALQARLVFLSGFRIGLLARTESHAAVQSNRLRGVDTRLPLVDVRDVVSCALVQNDGEVTGNEQAAPPVARLSCKHANAAHNRLVVGRDARALEMHVAAASVAVLGNLTRGQIVVGEPAPQPLQAPWLPLNINI